MLDPHDAAHENYGSAPVDGTYRRWPGATASETGTGGSQAKYGEYSDPVHLKTPTRM